MGEKKEEKGGRRPLALTRGGEDAKKREGKKEPLFDYSVFTSLYDCRKQWGEKSKKCPKPHSPELRNGELVKEKGKGEEKMRPPRD